MQWVIILFSILHFVSHPQQEHPFYEQIAFDFYSDVIVDSFPTGKRLRINEFILDVHPSKVYQDIANCSLSEVASPEYRSKPIYNYASNQLNISGSQFSLDLTNVDKKKFRVKSNGKGSYPKIQISLPYYHPLDSNVLLVTVYENHSELKSNLYTLKITTDGEVASWCRDERKYIRVH